MKLGKEGAPPPMEDVNGRSLDEGGLSGGTGQQRKRQADAADLDLGPSTAKPRAEAESLHDAESLHALDAAGQSLHDQRGIGARAGTAAAPEAHQSGRGGNCGPHPRVWVGRNGSRFVFKQRTGRSSFDSRGRRIQRCLQPQQGEALDFRRDDAIGNGRRQPLSPHAIGGSIGGVTTGCNDVEKAAPGSVVRRNESEDPSSDSSDDETPQERKGGARFECNDAEKENTLDGTGSVVRRNESEDPSSNGSDNEKAPRFDEKKPESSPPARRTRSATRRTRKVSLEVEDLEPQAAEESSDNDGADDKPEDAGVEEIGFTLNRPTEENRDAIASGVEVAPGDSIEELDVSAAIEAARAESRDAGVAIARRLVDGLPGRVLEYVGGPYQVAHVLGQRPGGLDLLRRYLDDTGYTGYAGNNDRLLADQWRDTDEFRALEQIELSADEAQVVGPALVPPDGRLLRLEEGRFAFIAHFPPRDSAIANGRLLNLDDDGQLGAVCWKATFDLTVTTFSVVFGAPRGDAKLIVLNTGLVANLFPFEADATANTNSASRPFFRNVRERTDPLTRPLIERLPDWLPNLSAALVFGNPAWEFMEDVNLPDGMLVQTGMLAHMTLIVMCWLTERQREKLVWAIIKMLARLMGVDDPVVTDEQLNEIYAGLPARSGRWVLEELLQPTFLELVHLHMDLPNCPLSLWLLSVIDEHYHIMGTWSRNELLGFHQSMMRAREHGQLMCVGVWQCNGENCNKTAIVAFGAEHEGSPTHTNDRNRCGGNYCMRPVLDRQGQPVLDEDGTQRMVNGGILGQCTAAGCRTVTLLNMRRCSTHANTIKNPSIPATSHDEDGTVLRNLGNMRVAVFDVFTGHLITWDDSTAIYAQYAKAAAQAEIDAGHPERVPETMMRARRPVALRKDRDACEAFRACIGNPPRDGEDVLLYPEDPNGVKWGSHTGVVILNGLRFEGFGWAFGVCQITSNTRF